MNDAISDELERTALQKELAGLARRSVPLDPNALMSCPHLLDSPRVRIGTSAHATAETRAAEAVTVFESVTNSISNARDRYVARAAFGLYPFTQASVGARQDKFVEITAYSRGLYDARRPEVIAQLATLLRITAWQRTYEPYDAINPDEIESASNASKESLALAAVTLQFACTAIRCAQELDLGIIFQLERAPSGPPVFRDRAGCFEDLMRAADEFAIRSFDFLTSCDSAEAERPARESVLDLADRTLTYLGLKWDDAENRWLVGQRLQRAQFPKAIVRQSVSTKIFESATLDAVALAASDIFDLVSGHDRPYRAQGRREAHKILSRYYAFDEWAPVLNGYSLRDRADDFFDRHMYHLQRARRHT